MEICPKCKSQLDHEINTDSGLLEHSCPKCNMSIFDMTLAQFANWMRDNVSDADHSPAFSPLFKKGWSVFFAQKSAFVNGNEIRFTASMTDYDSGIDTLTIETLKINGANAENFYFALEVTNAWAHDDERTYKLKGYQFSPTMTLWDALIDAYQKILRDSQKRANEQYAFNVDTLHKLGMEKTR